MLVVLSIHLYMKVWYSNTEAMQNNCPVLCCDNLHLEIGQNSVEYFEPVT